MAEGESSDWGTYRRLIISQLDDINQSIGRINDKIERFRSEDINQIKTELALLKMQAALLGSIAGIVSSGAVALMIKLIR
jgi:hypothetical protein